MARDKGRSASKGNGGEPGTDEDEGTWDTGGRGERVQTEEVGEDTVVDMELNDERRAPDAPGESWYIKGAHEHDLKLVAVAVDERIDRLRTLQKKNADEGYLRESRVVAADADRLKEAILPALSLEQREFPIATTVEARLGIANQLHDVIRRYVRDSQGPEDNPHEDFENEVCQRVERFARQIAERAFAAGLAVRAAHPAQFMLDALPQLEHRELKETVAAG